MSKSPYLNYDLWRVAEKVVICDHIDSGPGLVKTKVAMRGERGPSRPIVCGRHGLFAKPARRGIDGESREHRGHRGALQLRRRLDLGAGTPGL